MRFFPQSLSTTSTTTSAWWCSYPLLSSYNGSRSFFSSTSMSVLVVAKFPSVAAIFMALAASALLLLVAHIMFSFMRLWSCPLARSGSEEKSATLSLFLFRIFRNARATLQPWNSPASLPFTLLTEKMPPPAGSSVSALPKRLPLVRWHSRTSGPQFQPPREYFTCLEF